VHVGLHGVIEDLNPIFSLGNLEPNFFVKHDSEPIWSAKRWQNLKQEIFSKKNLKQENYYTYIKTKSKKTVTE